MGSNLNIPKAAKTGGFTLTELLVVIAIILVVAAMGVPTFMPFFRGRALRAAADLVKQSCIQARSLAVQERMEFRVVLISRTGAEAEQSIAVEPDPDEFEERLQDLDDEQADILQQRVPEKVPLPEGVAIRLPGDQADAHGVFYVFTPSGLLRPEGVLFRVGSGGDRVMLERVAIEDDGEAFSIVDEREGAVRTIYMFPTTGRVICEETEIDLD